MRGLTEVESFVVNKDLTEYGYGLEGRREKGWTQRKMIEGIPKSRNLFRAKRPTTRNNSKINPR